jgi:hypothetical protein
MFQIKTRRLTEYLQNTLSSELTSKYTAGFEFLCPNAPLHLSPPDFPGSSAVESENSDAWAWWRGLDVVNEYKELPTTMLFLYKYIQENGPVDGVVGFSQGGAMALMFASWCEARTRPERRQALANQAVPFTMEPPQDPLKFVVCLSGFRGTMKYYEGFYNPKIQTPTLHITAALDTLVSEARSAELIGSCESSQTMSHPGGHHVPCERKFLSVVTAFVEARLLDVGDAGDDMYGHDAYYGSDSSLESVNSSISTSSRRPNRRLQFRRLHSSSRRVYLLRGHECGIDSYI